MRQVTWLALIGALLIVSCVDVEEEDGVIVLTDETFDSALETHSALLVKFYAPWCNYCNELAPEYAKAAATLRLEGSDVRLAKLDATANKEIAVRFQVRGYPVLKFFRDGVASEYEGGRDAASIANWLRKRTGPAAVAVDDAAGMATFARDKDAYAVGYFEDQQSEAALAFKAAALDIDVIPFAITSSPQLSKALNVASVAAITLVSAADGRLDTMTDGFDVDGIKAWLHAHRLAVVTEFSQERAQQIIGGAIKQFAMLFVSKKAEEFASAYAAFSTAAEAFRGRTVYLLMSADDAGTAAIIGDFFGLTERQMPIVFMVTFSDHSIRKYPADFAELTAESIIDLNERFLAGQLKAQLLSAELPEDWDAQPVKVLVGSNFNDVIKSGKAVFVQFYSPQCGHCKQLEPVWEQIAAKFEAFSDRLIIAKLDATVNEVDGADIRSYPTLKLYHAHSQKVVDYKGKRSLDLLTEFIEEQMNLSPETNDRSEL